MPKDKTPSLSKTGGDKVTDLTALVSRNYLVIAKPDLNLINYFKSPDDFSADIVTNLHAAITKSECQRALNTLVEKELISTKLYGKQAIYVVRQDTIDTSTPEELAAIDREMSQLQSQIEESKKRNKTLSSEQPIKTPSFSVKLWDSSRVSRRKSASHMFATVTENLPGKPRDLMEELGIDTQDPFDINVNLKELVQA
ncbi:hypothetical protein BGZ46_000104 [Entomortierella lignicola]|nr:hypothetical protein BGZ46_000104 [Entomortierella lignicola]